MGNLLDWNTLNNKVAVLVDPDNGVELLQQAFPILMVATLVGASEEEAADAITDGGKDRGVDAVYITDDNQIHIFQFKYATKFEGSKKNFPSGEIDKLASYFIDVLNKEKKLKETCNALLWSKTQEIWAAIDLLP
jgi:hypothetical protein